MSSTLTTKLRRDLRRRRVQVAAVAVIVAAGLALFGATRDAFRSLVASYEQLYDQLAFADVWVTGGDVDAIDAALTERGDVAAVEHRAQVDVPLRFGGDHPLLGRVVAVPANAPPAVNRLLALDGADTPGDGVLLEQHAAQHYGLGPGDSLEVRVGTTWERVDIAGIVASAEYVWPARSRQDIITSPDDFAVVYADAGLVGRAAGDPVEQLLVRISADAPPGAAADIEAVAADLGALDVYDRLDQPSNSALQEDVQGFGELSYLFPVLFLTGAGLGAWVLLTRVVMTEQGVIGTLLASGVDRRRIRRHYLAFGIVVVLIGAVPGVLAGLVLAGIVAGAYTDAVSVPITVTKLDALTPLVGVSFAIAAGVLSAWAPARRAMRLEPAEAMRGAVPTARHGAAWWERVIPGWSHLPATGLMVIRGVGRVPRRTLTTMLGVVLACTMILVTAGMIDTVIVLLDRQFSVIQRDDARVTFAEGAEPAALSRLGAVDGVAAVEPVVFLDIGLATEKGRYATSLVGYESGTTMHGFRVTDGADALPSDGILLGSGARSVLGVAKGDTVTVTIPALDVTYDERVGGFVSEPVGTFAYASLSHLAGRAADLGVDGARAPAAALVRYQDGVDRAAMRIRLSEVPGVLAVSDTQALVATIEDFVGLFFAMVGIMLVFGAVLAFALVFNAMTVNLAERRVEAATLMAVGVPYRRLARLLTAENLMVTIMGLLPGLAVGWLVAREFMAAFQSDQFDFALQVRWTTWVMCCVAIVGVALLSQWPGLRAMRRVDIAQVVRERSL